MSAKNYWSCACGYLHLEPHGGMVCKCGAVYEPPLTVTPTAHGQDIGPAPQWSTTPPGEPGWYWTRLPGNDRTRMCTHLYRSLDGHGPMYTENSLSTRPLGEGINYEWWPVRIEPPR
jgi:hypothetical protein